MKEFFEIKYWHNGGMVDAVDSKRSVHRLCICTGDDLAGSSPACATFIREIGVTAARQDLALKEEFRLLYLLPS